MGIASCFGNAQCKGGHPTSAEPPTDINMAGPTAILGTAEGTSPFPLCPDSSPSVAPSATASTDPSYAYIAEDVAALLTPAIWCTLINYVLPLYIPFIT